MALVYRTIDSPVGSLKLVASDAGLVAITWPNDSLTRVRLDDAVCESEHPVLLQTERELNEYFAGARKVFATPLDLRGTPFQRRVWQALLEIPYGETRTYGQLATELGSANSSRAVGAANGRNPVSVIVPCHRVIGASGKLVGFAGGLNVKAHLLELEQGTRQSQFALTFG